MTPKNVFNKALIYVNAILERLRRFETGSASPHDNEKNSKAILCRVLDVFDYETLATLSLWSAEHAALIYDSLVKMNTTRLPKANEIMHEYTSKRIKQCIDGTFEERVLEDVITPAVFPHPPSSSSSSSTLIKSEKKEIKKGPREYFFYVNERTMEEKEEEEGKITEPPFIIYVNEESYFETNRAKPKTWEDPDETMVDPDFWNLMPSREKPVTTSTTTRMTTITPLEKRALPSVPIYYPSSEFPTPLFLAVKNLKEEEEEEKESESAIIHFKGSPEEGDRWLTNYVKLCEDARKILFELGKRLFSAKEEPKPESKVELRPAVEGQSPSKEGLQIGEAYARLERLAETSSDVAFSIWRGLSIEHRIVLANPAFGQSNRSAHLKTLRIVKISAERP